MQLFLRSKVCAAVPGGGSVEASHSAHVQMKGFCTKSSVK